MLVNKRLEIGLRLLWDLAKNPDQLQKARDIALRFRHFAKSPVES